MKHRITKLVSLALAAIMLLSLFVAPVFAEAADPVTLSIMIPSKTGHMKSDAMFNEKLEADCNVKLEWEIVADITTTKPLLLASNDLPDVFLNCSITTEEAVTYGEKGVFVDVKPLIDEYGVYIHNVTAYDPSWVAECTLPSGKITGLPMYSKTYHTCSSNKMWVNTAWRESLGIAVPETTEEFYDMLVAFRDKDPNGNGEKDEIPLSMTSGNVVGYLMGSFIQGGIGAFTFTQPYAGKADVTANKEEYREGLRFISKLYAEGLMDIESFTQDNNLLIQKVEQNKVGATVSYAPSGFAQADTEAFASYDAIAPLTGPNGLKTAPYTGNPTFPNYWVITSACENPVEAFKVGDYCYSEEATWALVYGREGVEWERPAEGEIGINGKQATRRMLDAFASTTYNWGTSSPLFLTADTRLSEVAASKEDYYKLAGQETRLYDATTLYEPYWSTDKVPNNLYIAPEYIAEYSDLKTTLTEFVEESVARFITGDMSLDNDWDAYVDELEAIGLSRYLELVQGAIG